MTVKAVGQVPSYRVETPPPPGRKYELGKIYSVPDNHKPKPPEIEPWQGWMVIDRDPDRPGNVFAELYTVWGD